MRTLGGLLAVMLALVAAAGCGDDEQERVDGTGYSYAVPEGWDDVSEDTADEPSLELGGTRPDSLVVGDREDSFTVNVNVIVETGVPAGVESREYADASVTGLRDPAGSGLPPDVVEVIGRMQPRDFSPTRETELGGEEAAAYDYTGTGDGLTLHLRQVTAVRGRGGYTLTLTVPPDRLDEGVDALDEIVDSWRWD